MHSSLLIITPLLSRRELPLTSSCRITICLLSQRTHGWAVFNGLFQPTVGNVSSGQSIFTCHSLTSLVCDSVSQSLTISGRTAKIQFYREKSEDQTHTKPATWEGTAEGSARFLSATTILLLFTVSMEICPGTLMALFLARVVSQWQHFIDTDTKQREIEENIQECGKTQNNRCNISG